MIRQLPDGTWEIQGPESMKTQITMSESKEKANQYIENYRMVLNFLGDMGNQVRVNNNFHVITEEQATRAGVKHTASSEGIRAVHQLLPKVYSETLSKEIQGTMESLVGVSDTSDILDNIRRHLERLSEPASRDAVIEQLNILTQISKNQPKKIQKEINGLINVVIKSMKQRISSTAGESLAGDMNLSLAAMNKYLFNPDTGAPTNAHEAIRKAIEGYKEGTSQIYNLLNQIEALGRYENTRIDAFMITADLKSQLVRSMKDQGLTTEHSLQELIDTWNNTRRFADYEKITKASMQSINHLRALNTDLKSPSYAENVGDLLYRMDTSHRRKTMQELAIRYNIRNAMIPERVFDDVVTSKLIDNTKEPREIYKEVVTYVEAQINSDPSLSASEKVKRRTEFREQGYNKLLSFAKNSFDSPTLIVRGNTGEITTTQSFRQKGDDFFDHAGRKGIGLVWGRDLGKQGNQNISVVEMSKSDFEALQLNVIDPKELHIIMTGEEITDLN